MEGVMTQDNVEGVMTEDNVARMPMATMEEHVVEPAVEQDDSEEDSDDRKLAAIDDRKLVWKETEQKPRMQETEQKPRMQEAVQGSVAHMPRMRPHMAMMQVRVQENAATVVKQEY
jgi:hypothetical protein